MKTGKCPYGYCINGTLYWRGREEPCPHCTNELDKRKCEECGGTGKIHSHNDTCWDCDGRGWNVLGPIPEIL